jgi:hypothetical protein
MTTKRSAGTNDLHDEIDFFREKILQMLLELQEQQERPEVGTIACALIEIAIDLASLMPQRSARSRFFGGNRPRWPRSDSAARSTACEARAIATGLAALDRGIRGDKFADKTWPQDRDVALIIRGSVNPRTRDDAPALQAILLARRTRA